MKKLTKEQWIGVVVAGAVVGGFLGAELIGLRATARGPIEQNTPQRLSLEGLSGTFTEIAEETGLKEDEYTTEKLRRYPIFFNDVRIGEGPAVEVGDRVLIHYLAAFGDQKVFDSSIERNEPYVFTVGAGQVIEGLDVGVKGMQPGGERVLVIPPERAYGSEGAGVVPPDTLLMFKVFLLDLEKADE